MKNYLKLMRPKHYIKNLLIFFPIIFSTNLLNINLFIKVFASFMAFNLASSFVYIINDIKDKEKDKLHNIKKNRPIASGKVSVKKAFVLAIFLLIISLLILYFTKVNIESYVYLILYIIINILYSLGLKNIALLDVMILALGFLIRLLYGASIINVEVSPWLYLTIMSFSFYLGLGKRRNEIIKIGKETRGVLKYYNEEFLDKNMYMCLSISIVFYALWTAFSDNYLLIWTVPLFILILMKYSLNIEKDSLGDPVDVVLNDKILIGLILVYGILLFSLIYLVK